MDVFDAVRTVLAVREYEARAVPDESVRKIVEAAHLTGSSMNGQPWHFVVVRDPAALRQLGSLVKTGPYIAGAPLAVAVAYERESAFGVSDASRAIQSMMLTAWSEGIASNWAGFHGLDGVRELLAVPRKFDVLAVVSFGYPRAAVGRGKKRRKSLREVVSSERFGEPFA